VFSKSFHYSAYFSSIFSISFHNSTYFSSAFSLWKKDKLNSEIIWKIQKNIVKW
jgi:hypothetical protein